MGKGYNPHPRQLESRDLFILPVLVNNSTNFKLINRTIWIFRNNRLDVWLCRGPDYPVNRKESRFICIFSHVELLLSEPGLRPGL